MSGILAAREDMDWLREFRFLDMGVVLEGIRLTVKHGVVGNPAWNPCPR